jgi:hypothetical protein
MQTIFLQPLFLPLRLRGGLLNRRTGFQRRCPPRRWCVPPTVASRASACASCQRCDKTRRWIISRTRDTRPSRPPSSSHFVIQHAKFRSRPSSSPPPSEDRSCPKADPYHDA